MTAPVEPPAADVEPPAEPVDETAPDEIFTWPLLVRIEFLWTLAAMIIVTVWSIVIDAPLESPANPTVTPDPSKAPWYFLGLQELLVYFDPWIAGVMLPLLIIFGLAAIPYLDPNPKGNGYFTFIERPFAIVTFLFGFVVLWTIPLLIGTFCRGPGWNWYWPWESWLVPKHGHLPNTNLSDLLGVAEGWPAFLVGAVFVLGWYALGFVFYRVKRRSPMLLALGPWRYAVLAFLFLSMMGIPVKVVVMRKKL